MDNTFYQSKSLTRNDDRTKLQLYVSSEMLADAIYMRCYMMQYQTDAVAVIDG